MPNKYGINYGYCFNDYLTSEYIPFTFSMTTNSNLNIKKPTEGTKVSKSEYIKIVEEKINELKRGVGNSLRN